jgi:SAM-dependent methyltransferase
MERHVRSVEDVLRLLDGMFAAAEDRWTDSGGEDFWNGFYGDRDRPIPFFAAKPDENLASYMARGLIAPGRVLELGCGPGRNALHLARHGYEVEAVDLSPAAVAWARERAARDQVSGVRFRCADIFAADLALAGPYDLVYDSGCFHHLPPHRRVSYLALLERVLAPGGFFGLACFAAGQMGAEAPDEAFYRDGTLRGGLAYSPEALRHIFAGFEEVEVRPMVDEPAEAEYFGEPFLLTALFRRAGESAV